MSDSLHKLQVIIEGNAKGLNNATKNAMATVNNLQKKMQELKKETEIAMGLKVRTNEYKNLKKDLSEAEEEANKLNKKLKDLGDGKAPNETYQEFQAKLAGAKAGLESLKTAQEKYVAQGKDGSSFTKGIVQAEREVQRYEKLLEDMRNAGTDMATTKEFQKASEEAYKASEKIEHLKGKIDELVESGKDIEQTSFGKALTTVGNGMMRAFQKPLAAIRKASGAFSALIQKFKTTGHHLGDPFKQGIGSIFKYVLGIGALVKAFQLLRRGISEGMGMLSKYSQQTRYDLNSLTAGLNTVKLSLANAFAPVLTVIAPILNTLMDMLVDAMNVVSAFFATLTGSSTYNKASRAAMDYGAAMDSAAGSAGNATEANEKLKRSIMGFDQINKLDDTSSSGGSGGSGGGGGGAGGGQGAGLSMEQVPTAVSNFAEMVKKAWEESNFTDVGRVVGEKLRDALNDIPYEGIRKSCNKIATDVATFLNGFFGTRGLANSVGSAIGGMINTGIDAAYTFISTLKPELIGAFIGGAIKKAIEDIDFAKAGLTLSKFTTAFFTAISTAVEGVPWRAFGEKVGTFLTNIRWGEVLQTAARTFTSVFCGLLDFAAGLITSLMKAITPENLRKAAEKLWEVLKGCWEQICSTDALSGIDQGVLNAIGEALLVIGGGLAAIKAVTGIQAIITGITGAIGALCGTAGTIATFTLALDPFLVALGLLATWAVVEGPKIVETFKSVKEGVESLPQAFADAATKLDTESAMREVISEIAENMDQYNVLVETLNGASLDPNSSTYSIFSAISEQAKQLGLDTSELRSLFIEEMGNMGLSAETQKAILDEIDGTVKNIGEHSTGIKLNFSGLDPKILEFFDKIKGEGGETVVKIKAVAENALGTVGQTIKDFWDTVVTDKRKLTAGAKLESGSKATVKETKSLWSSIKNKTATLNAKAKSPSKTLTNLLSRWVKVETKTVSLTASARDTTGGTVKTIADKWATITNKAVHLTSKISTNNESLWAKVVSAFALPAQKAVQFTANATDAVKQAFLKVLGIQLAKGGIYDGGTWQSIPQYAAGGSQRGGLFWAGEAGPEIVARGSGGRSEILNKSQIASAIHDAVLAAMMQSNQGSRQPTQINVYVGGKRVADVVVEEVNNRTRSTGKCPILI